MSLPTNADDLLPMFAATGRLGEAVVILFTIGIVASSFSSADSALTAMTTTYCVDIKERAGDERLRKRVHVGMAVVFMLIILMVDAVNSTSVIDFIYILCSYTYGPLLGLFAFGLLTKRKIGNVFDKPNDQSQTCLSYGMARKGRMKFNQSLSWDCTIIVTL